MRPHIKIAALSICLLTVCPGPGQASGTAATHDHSQANALSSRKFRGDAPTLTVSSLSAMAVESSAYNITLPPEEKPKTHWPWWLRILAVIGVLLFIRIVAGSVRSKPSGPGPT